MKFDFSGRGRRLGRASLSVSITVLVIAFLLGRAEKKALGEIALKGHTYVAPELTEAELGDKIARAGYPLVSRIRLL